jgi:endonuclease-3 related protein
LDQSHAYTRRIVTNLELVDEKADYDEIKALFEESIPHDMKMYQEYHALLVEHAKKYYQKKGSYANCSLLNIVQD